MQNGQKKQKGNLDISRISKWGTKQNTLTELMECHRRKGISFWGHTGKFKKTGHTRKMHFFQGHRGKKLNKKLLKNCRFLGA
jgi:hypothetical protein